MRSTAEYNGVRVLAGKHGTRRIGKVLRAVFFPDDYRFAGLIVRRPDFLFMFQRSDRFLAWDRMQLDGGKLIANDVSDSWDEKAQKRIQLDWDKALILQGMAVVEAQGDKLGTIDDIEFDPVTGISQNIVLSSGIGAKTLVGQMRVPLTDIASYHDMSLIMRAGAPTPDVDGGLAAAAAKQTAMVGSKIKTATTSANTAVGELVDRAGEGAEKLGYQTGKAVRTVADKVTAKSSSEQKTTAQATGNAVGKQLGRAKGMFKSFQDEYKRASK
jgi:sporulation protein YlmC with PRC-barrel domain